MDQATTVPQSWTRLLKQGKLEKTKLCVAFA